MIGVGYRAAVSGTALTLNLGYSHPVEMPIPSGISVKVEKNTTIQVRAPGLAPGCCPCAQVVIEQGIVCRVDLGVGVHVWGTNGQDSWYGGGVQGVPAEDFTCCQLNAVLLRARVVPSRLPSPPSMPAALPLTHPPFAPRRTNILC
jgi:hypothetical protein